MQKIKEESGVTLVALIITIIILVILAGVSLNFGNDSVIYSRDTQLEAELQIVQQACISEYTKAKELGLINGNERPSNFVGEIVPVSSLPVISETKDWIFESEPAKASQKYYRLTPDDLEDIKIKNSQCTYIVNYYSGEVFNETTQTSEEEPLYIRAIEEHVDDDERNDTTSFTNW